MNYVQLTTCAGTDTHRSFLMTSIRMSNACVPTSKRNCWIENGNSNDMQQAMQHKCTNVVCTISFSVKEDKDTGLSHIAHLWHCLQSTHSISAIICQCCSRYTIAQLLHLKTKETHSKYKYIKDLAQKHSNTCMRMKFASTGFYLNIQS